MTDDELADTLLELSRLTPDGADTAWLADAVNRWLDELDEDGDGGARRDLLDAIGLAEDPRALGTAPGSIGAVQHHTDTVPVEQPTAPVPPEKKRSLRDRFSRRR